MQGIYITDAERNVYNEAGQLLGMCGRCYTEMIEGVACCGTFEAYSAGSDWEPRQFLEYFYPGLRDETLMETWSVQHILIEIQDRQDPDVDEWIVQDLRNGNQWNAEEFFNTFRYLLDQYPLDYS